MQIIRRQQKVTLGRDEVLSQNNIYHYHLMGDIAYWPQGPEIMSGNCLRLESQRDGGASIMIGSRI